MSEMVQFEAVLLLKRQTEKMLVLEIYVWQFVGSASISISLLHFFDSIFHEVARWRTDVGAWNVPVIGPHWILRKCISPDNRAQWQVGTNLRRLNVNQKLSH
eukprot:SAG31_NODE_15316_length_760_cov_63.715582_1_plen_101_part_10